MKWKLLALLVVLSMSLILVQAQVIFIDSIDVSDFTNVGDVHTLFEINQTPVNWSVYEGDTRCIEYGPESFCEAMGNAIAIEDVFQMQRSDGSTAYTFKVNRRVAEEDFEISITNLQESITELVLNIMRMRDIQCYLTAGEFQTLACY